MNYDEYSWGFNPNAANSGDYDYSKTTQPSDDDDSDSLCPSMGGGCVNSDCCSEGMIYDNDKKKCIENMHKESFIPGRQFNKNKRSYVNMDGVQPYSEGVQFSSVAF